jgi:glutaredoxin
MGNLVKLVFVAALLYGGWRHFTADDRREALVTEANIEVYTTPQCPYCKAARAYMDERGIPYIEKDVENDSDNRREFLARGGNGVPFFIMYGKPHSGFEQQRFEQALLEHSGG